MGAAFKQHPAITGALNTMPEKWLGMSRGARQMMVENPALFWSWVLGGVGSALPIIYYAFAKENDKRYTLHDVPDNMLLERLRTAESAV